MRISSHIALIVNAAAYGWTKTMRLQILIRRHKVSHKRYEIKSQLPLVRPRRILRYRLYPHGKHMVPGESRVNPRCNIIKSSRSIIMGILLADGCSEIPVTRVA